MTESITVVSVPEPTVSILTLGSAPSPTANAPTTGGARGPAGPPGPTGPAGPAGPPGTGAPGPQGPQGQKGDKGDRGDNGPMGFQGPPGDVGPKGDPGPEGPRGPQGLTGLNGAPGLRGPQGLQGPAGPQGEAGVQGLQGEIGPKGDTGPQGEQGPVGMKGDKGDVGEQGTQGTPGPKGDVGAIGPQGDKGEKGDKGDTGPQGPPGPAGSDTVGVSPTTSISRKRIAWVNPAAGSTSVWQGGITIIPAGTTSSPPMSAVNAHQIQRRITFSATAAANAVAGFRASSAGWLRGTIGSKFGGFEYVCRFGPATGVAADATRRGFCGLSTTAVVMNVEPSSIQNLIGVGCDSADINYQIMYRNGTGAVTKVDTGIPKSAADNTEAFELRMSCAVGGGVSFQFTNLNTGSVFSHTTTTNLPDETTFFAPLGYYSVGSVSSVIGFALMHLHIETDY